MAVTTSPPPRDLVRRDLVPAGFVPRDLVEHPDPEALIKEARRRARRRRMVNGAAAATMVGVAAVTALNLATPPQDQEPGVDTLAGAPSVGVIVPGPWVDGAVWYDLDGLHHGNRVVQTAVPLFLYDLPGALALVRNGALYDDLRTRQVWFHPWDGQPRVVGHDSIGGPGGDPQGDVAAWFEGTELVVYDTAVGAVISRTTESPVLEDPFRAYIGGFEHVSGNGFMHVSDEEVVWRSAEGTRRLDVATGRSALLHESSQTTNLRLEDVHHGTRVWGSYQTAGVTVEIAGRRQSQVTGVEPPGRLSPDGSFVAAPWRDGESLGVAFLNVRTGESWVVAGEEWNAWISWSYGHIAVVRVERGTTGPEIEFLACDAVKRTCERLSDNDDSFFSLLPNS